jgi:hypothetical protein
VAGPPGALLVVAGPLLLLLVLSRPARREEWLWVVATVLAIALMMRGTPSLVEQVSRALAVCFSGAFVVLTLLGIRSLSTRLIGGTAAAVAITTLWFARLGVRWDGFTAAVVGTMWDSLRVWSDRLAPTPIDRAMVEAMSPSALQASEPARMSYQAYLMADMFPALLCLGAMFGGWLAWGWYHRIAGRPIGVPPKPISALRFNDQLIWALILAFGLTLFKLPAPVALVSSNLLFVLGALYWARGLAITRYAMAMLPAPPLFKVAVTALLVLPLAFGGWLLMGVADTWLDIRRRLQPPQGVSS